MLTVVEKKTIEKGKIMHMTEKAEIAHQFNQSELTGMTRVTQWNVDCGNPRKPLGEADHRNVRHQMGLVAEEFSEAAVEIDAFNIDKVKAAKELGDILFTSIEAIRRLGYDPNVILNLVCDSNDSKFCSSNEEVRKALNDFAHQGLEVTPRGTDSGLIVFVSTKNQTVKEKFYPEGKILKPAGYFKAEQAITEYDQELQGASHG